MPGIDEIKAAGLSPKELAALNWRYYHSFSFRAIGKVMRVSVVRAFKLVGSGREKLAAVGFELPEIKAKHLPRGRVRLIDGSVMAGKFTYEDSYVNHAPR